MMQGRTWVPAVAALNLFAGIWSLGCCPVGASHGMLDADVVGAAVVDFFGLKSAFDQFLLDMNRTYSDQQEFEVRLKIFADNLKEIHEHNSRGTSPWKASVNKFSDLTRVSSRSRRTLPNSVDWRSKGVVTEVKDQGTCASCWAFTAVEQLESYLKLDSGLPEPPPVLSPQQLVSCAPRDLVCGGSGGCHGSISQLAFTYAQLYGVTSEKSYPYTATDGECLFDPRVQPAEVFIKGYEVLPHNDQEAMLHHLAKVGPLAVSVDNGKWKTYRSGVFDSCDYEANINLNHIVQLVGYGTDEETGLDFWLARNSWGKDWGEEGYIRLRRDKDVECGLDSTPLAGVGCIGDGNDVQKVCGMCGILFDSSYPISASPTSGISNEL